MKRQPDAVVVSDAGPLIALSTIGQVSLLPQLFRKIYIPGAVYDEVVLRGLGRPGEEEVRAADWIVVTAIRDRLAASLLLDELDAGESEALVLAAELPAQLILLDESRARIKAGQRGLAAMGMLGVLLLAKRQGLLTKVSPHLQALQRRSFRMSESVYRAVLVEAGETLPDRER